MSDENATLQGLIAAVAELTSEVKRLRSKVEDSHTSTDRPATAATAHRPTQVSPPAPPSTTSARSTADDGYGIGFVDYFESSMFSGI